MRTPNHSRFALLACVALILALPIPVSSASGIPMIDAHSQVDNGVSMERVLSLMNEAGISRSILSSLRGPRKTPEIVATAKLHPDRIVPSIGMKGKGLFNGDPANLARLRRMGAIPIFGAISEAMVCHHQKGNKAPEIIRDLDAPEVHEALAIALKRRWPFVIHIEFGYSKCRNGSYMKDLERLLARHPDQPVALTHMGQLGPIEVRRLIESHRNIYFLTSHANPVRRPRSNESWTNLFTGDVLAPEWRELFLRHQDRFVLAFDNVYDDDWGDLYLRQVRLFKTAFKDLPADVAHAVAHRNAERLWRLPPLSAAETPGAAGGNVGTQAAAGAIDRRQSNGPTTNEPEALPVNVKDLLGRLVASGYKSETTVDGRRRGEPHNAVDIRGKVGADVLAAADGHVTFAGDTPRGLAIFIAHGQNLDGFRYFTSYVHNAENLVKKGDSVKRGQVIAHLGDSGSKTVPHVHFQVNKGPPRQQTRNEGNTDVDPRLYWHAEKVCFDPDVRYPARPLRFTLPVRCAE